MEWLKYRDENDPQFENNKNGQWKVLIVDDDDQIHLITRQALSKFQFEEKSLDFISAYSGREARELLEKTQDHFAIILLDVVMESDDEGLKLASYIRSVLHNHYSRIILRTGQPGMAPEYSVVREYDIDAYISKTELRKSDLEALFYTVLRSYRDIIALQHQRKCIEQVVSSITTINSSTDLSDFSSAILSQISLLVGGSDGELLLDSSEAYAVSRNQEKTQVLAVSGQEERNKTLEISDTLQNLRSEVKKAINEGFEGSKSSYQNPYFVHYMRTHRNNEIIFTLKTNKPLNKNDNELLELFSSNVTLTYENLILNDEILETQNLLIRLLGGAMESRSRETGSHVRRVGELAALLGAAIGMAKDEVRRLRIAAPLHDVGKVSIPDAILNKPGSLNPEEWEIMKSHSIAGYELLKDTGHPIIEKAAKIARDHHERWNGEGYPLGTKGNEISLEGRIVALADVFDALISPRCYKDVWSTESAFDYIKKSSGEHFDPQLSDIFLKNKKEILHICSLYPE